MRLLIKLLIVFAACILLMGGCYLRMGGWMMISPKYKESRLLGLTRQEVVDRLGPPSYDPVEEARYTTRPWNEAEDGPQYLGYFQGAGTCVITFKDGKVDAVRKSWK